MGLDGNDKDAHKHARPVSAYMSCSVIKLVGLREVQRGGAAGVTHR
jgi:hypothetical protein